MDVGVARPHYDSVVAVEQQEAVQGDRTRPFTAKKRPKQGGAVRCGCG